MKKDELDKRKSPARQFGIDGDAWAASSTIAIRSVKGQFVLCLCLPEWSFLTSAVSLWSPDYVGGKKEQHY